MEKITVSKIKPNGECFVCHSKTWWWRPSGKDGDWLCGVCHPNSKKDEYIEPDYPGKVAPEQKIFLVKVQNMVELEALKQRVGAGNIKLWKAWEQLRDVSPIPEYDHQVELWRAAMNTLGTLAEELINKGFRNCLYVESGHKCEEDKKFMPGGCFYCPDQGFFLNKIFNEQPVKEFTPSHQGEELMEFLKTLGGKI